MLPNLSKLSLGSIEADAATQTGPGQPDVLYETAQDQVFGELADEIVRAIAANVGDAGDVCDAVATWCATHRPACSGNAVWAAALAAFNINTPEKRRTATRILMNMPNDLIPALTDRQLFNAICGRISHESPADDYHYDGLLFLTYRSRFANVPTTTLQLHALDREFVMQLQEHGADRGPAPFWAKLGKAMLQNPDEPEPDYMQVPWHERRPECTDRAVMAWLATAQVRNLAIARVTRGEDEDMEALVNAFGAHFQFGGYYTAPIPTTVTALQTVYGIVSGPDMTTTYTQLLEHHRDEYIRDIKTRVLGLAQRFYLEEVYDPTDPNVELALFGDDQRLAAAELWPVLSGYNISRTRLADRRFRTVRLPRSWILNEDAGRKWNIEHGMGGGPFWPKESLSPIFESAIETITDPFVLEMDKLDHYGGAFGPRSQMSVVTERNVMKQLAPWLWERYTFNTGIVWKWTKDYKPATRRFPASWPVRHGRILLQFARDVGTPGNPRLKRRMLIASGTPDAHNHYFYDVPARAIMLAHPTDFHSNIANRVYDPAALAQAAAIRAELDQVPIQ